MFIDLNSKWFAFVFKLAKLMNCQWRWQLSFVFRAENNQVWFKVRPNKLEMNAAAVASRIGKSNSLTRAPKAWDTDHSRSSRASHLPLENMDYFSLPFRLAPRLVLARETRFAGWRVESLSTFSLHRELDGSQIKPSMGKFVCTFGAMSVIQRKQKEIWEDTGDGGIANWK